MKHNEYLEKQKLKIDQAAGMYPKHHIQKSTITLHLQLLLRPMHSGINSAKELLSPHPGLGLKLAIISNNIYIT